MIYANRPLYCTAIIATSTFLGSHRTVSFSPIPRATTTTKTCTNDHPRCPTKNKIDDSGIKNCRCLSYTDKNNNKHNNNGFQLYGVTQARRYVAEGMLAFRRGQVHKSIEFFDQAEYEEPRYAPYLWQRGLSYYYVNEFHKARQQFRLDVKVNPLDVEEIVWDIASALRINPTSFPVPDAMSLPPNQNDRRPIMAIVYRLFRGQATEAELALGGTNTSSLSSSSSLSSLSLSNEFYSLFYLGLYTEGRQETTKAEHYMRQAVQTQYAQSIGQTDYMTAVAKVSMIFFQEHTDVGPGHTQACSLTFR